MTNDILQIKLYVNDVLLSYFPNETLQAYVYDVTGSYPPFSSATSATTTAPSRVTTAAGGGRSVSRPSTATVTALSANRQQSRPSTAILSPIPSRPPTAATSATSNTLAAVTVSESRPATTSNTNEDNLNTNLSNLSLESAIVIDNTNTTDVLDPTTIMTTLAENTENMTANDSFNNNEVMNGDITAAADDVDPMVSEDLFLELPTPIKTILTSQTRDLERLLQ